MTITADFSGGEKTVTTEPLYQWDTGQKLALSGLPATSTDIQVHFANAAMAQAIVKATELVDSLPTCDIPNEFLQFGSAAKARAWVFYKASSTEGYTVRAALIPITPRKRPNDYVSPEDPDSKGIVERAMELLENYQSDLNAKEEKSNKKTTLTGNESSNDFYPTTKAVADALNTKADVTYVDNIAEEVGDLKSAINAKSGLSDEAKQALLTCFEHVAWINDQGQSYVDALEAALYPPANLVSISAVYVQSGTVYDTDTLDSLKADLVVTATYDNGTTATVTAYTLSGTLTEGTSTITVSYGGKTTTFTVTVTAAPQYVTDGLIGQWDGINNTRSGHAQYALAWEDLVGNVDFTLDNIGKVTWESNALTMTGQSGQGARYSPTPFPTANENAYTFEVVFARDPSAEFVNNNEVAAYFGRTEGGAGGVTVNLYTDATYTIWSSGGKRYSGGSFDTLRSVAVSFSGLYGSNYSVYTNGAPAIETESEIPQWTQQTMTYAILGEAGVNYETRKFQGKIYAIRVYNRILTELEVAQNYATDVARFGLE